MDGILLIGVGLLGLLTGLVAGVAFRSSERAQETPTPPEPEIDERTRSQPFRRHTIYYEPDGEGIVVLRVLQDVVPA